MTGKDLQRRVAEQERFSIHAAGCEALVLEAEHAICRMKNDDRIKNDLGNPMGGALFTLGDYAFAVASNCVANRACVTQSATVSYLKAATGNWIYAEAQCVHSGRSSCVYTVHLRDDDGQEIALMTFTGHYLYQQGCD